MSKFFFNTENSVNPAWADVAEGFNSYYAGSGESLQPLDVGGITDHDQKISSYVKIDRKIGLYTTEKKKIVISMAAPVEGQNIGTKEIGLELVKEKLESGVKVVYFGFIFNEDMVSQNTVVEKSILFGRNTLDNALTNFENNSRIEGNVSAAVWMAFYKIKDCDIYYVVLNDNLIESSVMRMSKSEPDMRAGEDVFEFINSHDGNFKNSVFKPRIYDKIGNIVRSFGENVIVVSGDVVTIDVFGESQLHKMAGHWLTDDELPSIDIAIECNSTYTVDKNKITVQLFNTVSTLSYKWITGTDLDTLSSDKEQVRYDFVIIKI